jgi:hypothetical protein
VNRSLALGLALALTSGCGVKTVTGTTGGVDAGDAGACPRGYVVVTTDYASTNVALVGLDGTQLSPSFLSSGAKPPGLSAALSGDVDAPSDRAASGRVVLLDRFATSVVTWLDPKTGGVLGQLPVGTGFASNPHDYVEVAPGKAYVSRYETNPAPGKEPFDEGGDVLVVDTDRFAIVSRIPMPTVPGVLPRPDGMVRVGGSVFVVLQHLSADFTTSSSSSLAVVSIAEERVVAEVQLPGLANCGRPVLAPAGDRVLLACSGANLSKDAYDPAQSGIVAVDPRAVPPRELRRWKVAETLQAPVQPGLAMASDDLVVFGTFGRSAGGATDRSFLLSLSSGKIDGLHIAGKAWVLGTPRCAPGCSDLCLVPDAETSTLRRFRIFPDGRFELQGTVRADDVVGLPPRTLSTF